VPFTPASDLAGAVLPRGFELTEQVLDPPQAGDLARLSAAVGRAPAIAIPGQPNPVPVDSHRRTPDRARQSLGRGECR